MIDGYSKTPHTIDVDPSFRLHLVFPTDQISYLPIAERSPLYIDGLFLSPTLEMIAPEKVIQLVEREGIDLAEATLDKVTSILCRPLDFFIRGIVSEPSPKGVNLRALPDDITQGAIRDVQRLISARTRINHRRHRGKLTIGCFDDMSTAEKARTRIQEFYEDKLKPRKTPLVTFGPLERR